MPKWEDIPRDMVDPNHWLGVLFYALIMLIIAAVISRLIRLTATKVILRHENALIDKTVVLFLTQFAQILVYIIGLVIFFHIIPALNKLGTALLTGVSVMSVVFGLAAQNTLSNLVAGCTLMLYRPFHLDDMIQVATPTGTESGIVERLTLGYTMLRTADDRLVIVPNSLMASQVSLNLNRRSLHTMLLMSVGVADLSQMDDVRAALLDIARQDSRIHRVISCYNQVLEDGSAFVTLRAWCGYGTSAADVEKDITTAMEEHFKGQKAIYLMPSAPKTPPHA